MDEGPTFVGRTALLMGAVGVTAGILAVAGIVTVFYAFRGRPRCSRCR